MPPPQTLSSLSGVSFLGAGGDGRGRGGLRGLTPAPLRPSVRLLQGSHADLPVSSCSRSPLESQPPASVLADPVPPLGAMSDILLNLDAVLPQAAQKSSGGNKKHQRFVKRRQFLERKGFLKQKQLPSQPPMPRRDASLGCSAGPDRAKKKQRVEAKEGSKALPEEGPPCRLKMLPKESSDSGAVDPASRTSSSSAAAAASRKTGSVAGKSNGTLCSRGDVSRISLLNEFKSGLPDAPVLAKPSKMVAIDCEMVGTGPGGRNSDLARCSVVGYYGDVMYDKYIRPLSPITNYRTRWSGIRQHHMRDAVPFKLAQKEVR